MSLDSGSDVLHVCLRPAFVRLTAPADNKQCRAAADSERQAIAARQPGSLFGALGAGEAGTAAMPGAQLSEAWHSAGPALAPFN